VGGFSCHPWNWSCASANLRGSADLKQGSSAAMGDSGEQGQPTERATARTLSGSPVLTIPGDKNTPLVAIAC